jgi:hypothetical protein
MSQTSLFRNSDLGAFLKSERNSLSSRIAKLTKAELDGKTDEEVADEMIEKHFPKVPVLDRKPDGVPRRSEVSLTYQEHMPGQQAEADTPPEGYSGREFVFRVPFTGSPKYFNHRPSIWGSTSPMGKVEKDAVLFEFRVRNDEAPEEVEKRFDSELGAVQESLSNARIDYDAFAPNLRDDAVRSVKDRRAQLVSGEAADEYFKKRYE